MTITINWLTQIISVPQADLTALGGAQYGLNVETFRNILKDIEDSEAGMAHPVTHRRNAPVVLSGVTYAQTFEIINGYTITFENTGTPYLVLVSGANHNLADVTNFSGSMSMIVGNSAGLVVAATDTSGVAAAVLSAAQTTPIHSDIRRVKGQIVNGTGTTIDPWGP